MSMTVAGCIFNYLRWNADVSWGFWLRLMWGGSFSNPPFSDLRPVHQIGDRHRHSQNFGMCTATQKSYILERRALWTLPLQRMVVWRQPVPLSRCLFFFNKGCVCYVSGPWVFKSIRLKPALKTVTTNLFSNQSFRNCSCHSMVTLGVKSIGLILCLVFFFFLSLPLGTESQGPVFNPPHPPAHLWNGKPLYKQFTPLLLKMCSVLLQLQGRFSKITPFPKSLRRIAALKMLIKKWNPKNCGTLMHTSQVT